MYIHNEPQIRDTTHGEVTLLHVCLHVMRSKFLQNLFNVPQMLFPRCVEDQNIIQVNNDKSIKERMKYIIHEPHEYRRCISQTERHNQPLKKSLLHLEGYISLCPLPLF